MSPTTTLLLAPALAPLTGLDSQGCAVRDLARALQAKGWKVTVAIAIDLETDTNQVGLARRLEPIDVEGTALVVHEGYVEGDIQLFAFASPEGPKPSALTCLRAISQLQSDELEVLQLWSSTLEGIEASALPTEGQKVVVHLESTAHREALKAADLLLLRSAFDAKKERRKADSPLAPHSHKLLGLCPGFDEREWNPARDSVLKSRMDPPTLENKTSAKAALRAELGLKDSDVPLIGIVSRFKIPRALGEELLGLPLQLAGVGAGPDVEALASRAPLKAACPRALSDYQHRQLRHRIVAGADFILMPGTAEPTSQLYPCRYGTAVIASKQGEFAERIANFDVLTQTGCGFLYGKDELINAIRAALSVYQAGPELRQALIERCLQLDLSWDTVALRLGEMVANT